MTFNLSTTWIDRDAGVKENTYTYAHIHTYTKIKNGTEQNETKKYCRTTEWKKKSTQAKSKYVMNLKWWRKKQFGDTKLMELDLTVWTKNNDTKCLRAKLQSSDATKMLLLMEIVCVCECIFQEREK